MSEKARFLGPTRWRHLVERAWSAPTLMEHTGTLAVTQQGAQLLLASNFLSLFQDEPQDEPIYMECEANTDLVPCKVLPSPILEPLTCLLKQAKTKISPLGPQQGFPENNPEARCLKTDVLPEDPDMKNAAWYAGSCDRRTAEAALLRFNKNSAFMVRQSSHHSLSQPFTLVVLYKSHVYNVPIHYRESSCQFVLGKDGKSHEELFDSVSSIIQKYSERPLVLIDGSTSAKEQTRLLFPVTP
ncbi:SH2 domain-containing protein 6 [Candoia aspera]|uniref:SH2 domain-containing protein 6 n=1 Tax=Candoia aspera TaxID=51853 RepID=UPI002FD80015